MDENELNTFKANLKEKIVENMRFTQEQNVFSFDLPEGFTEWLLDNGEVFKLTFPNIPKDIKVTKAVAGNCFQNSQLVTLQNENVLYYEGLWIINKNKIIHHGFNFMDNKILDVSYLENKLDYDKEMGGAEFYYFGIMINKDHFENDSQIFNQNFYNNHLLLSYYNSI